MANSIDIKASKRFEAMKLLDSLTLDYEHYENGDGSAVTFTINESDETLTDVMDKLEELNIG